MRMLFIMFLLIVIMIETGETKDIYTNPKLDGLDDATKRQLRRGSSSSSRSSSRSSRSSSSYYKSYISKVKAYTGSFYGWRSYGKLYMYYLPPNYYTAIGFYSPVYKNTQVLQRSLQHVLFSWFSL